MTILAGKLTIFSGLPGSGKSTIAQKRVDISAPGTVLRVNRDDIRTALFGEEYHKRNPDKKSEQTVTEVQQRVIKKALKENRHVISDDTNLNPNAVLSLRRIARTFGAEIEHEYVNTPVQECKRRNKLRGKNGGRFVPEHIIDNMAAKAYDKNGNIKEYVFGSKDTAFLVSKKTPGSQKIEKFNKENQSKYPFNGRTVVLVDLDGTLANNAKDADLCFGDYNKKKDFHNFHKASEHAPANEKVLRLIRDMRSDNLNIIVLSGRTDKYAQETINFLKNIDAPVSRLILKKEGDYRPDTDFKTETLQKLREEGLIVAHSIDDRPQSINVWRKAGITVSEVLYHKPVHPDLSPAHYDTPPVKTIFGSGHCIRCGQELKNGGNIGPICRTKMSI